MREIIRNDPIVRKRIKGINEFGKKTDIWLEDLINLQLSLPVSALNTSGLLQSAQHKLVDSNIKVQSNRSRAVHIKMQAFKEHLMMKETLNRLKGYILSNYIDDLKAISKTITERRAFVDSLLENQKKVENRLDSVVKLADMVIDDATASGFTLKRIQETLEQKVKDR